MCKPSSVKHVAPGRVGPRGKHFEVGVKSFPAVGARRIGSVRALTTSASPKHHEHVPPTPQQFEMGRLDAAAQCGGAPSCDPLLRHNALLVGQTLRFSEVVLKYVPTRPSQNDPKRVAAWERRRRSLGTRIQRLRIERGLTQEQLALLSGLSRNVLMDVEHGRRVFCMRLSDIAKPLGVSAADLLEGIR